jgi:hypothetical protein
MSLGTLLFLGIGRAVGEGICMNTPMLIVHVQETGNRRIQVKSRKMIIGSAWVSSGSREAVIKVPVRVRELCEGMLLASVDGNVICSTLTNAGACKARGRCSWSLNYIIDRMRWKDLVVCDI